MTTDGGPRILANMRESEGRGPFIGLPYKNVEAQHKILFTKTINIIWYIFNPKIQ